MRQTYISVTKIQTDFPAFSQNPLDPREAVLGCAAACVIWPPRSRASLRGEKGMGRRRWPIGAPHRRARLSPSVGKLDGVARNAEVLRDFPQ